MAQKLTNDIIDAAIRGFEAKKTADRHPNQRTPGRCFLVVNTDIPPPRRSGTTQAQVSCCRTSAHGSRKQKRVGQKVKGESEPCVTSVTPEPTKPKRKLSKAGRANIVAALKKRWAAKKAARRLPVAKKTARKKAVKKAAVKTAPAKAAKRKTPAKKSAVKKAAPATVPAEVAG